MNDRCSFKSKVFLGLHVVKSHDLSLSGSQGGALYDLIVIAIDRMYMHVCLSFPDLSPTSD